MEEQIVGCGVDGAGENTGGCFRYADPRRRFLAYLLDVMLLFIVDAVLIWGSKSASSSLTFLGLSLILPAAYFALTESSVYSGSVGKQLMALTVVTVDRKRIGIVRAFIRYTLLSLLFVVPAVLVSGKTGDVPFLAYVGYWIPLLLLNTMIILEFEKRQGLHDLATRTVVLHDPTRENWFRTLGPTSTGLLVGAILTAYLCSVALTSGQSSDIVFPAMLGYVLFAGLPTGFGVAAYKIYRKRHPAGTERRQDIGTGVKPRRTGGATITVEWGYENHSIYLDKDQWSRVKNQEPLEIDGDGYWYDGEFFHDYWQFGGGLQGSLSVGYDDGGQGFIGRLVDAMIEPDDPADDYLQNKQEDPVPEDPESGKLVANFVPRRSPTWYVESPMQQWLATASDDDLVCVGNYFWCRGKEPDDGNQAASLFGIAAHRGSPVGQRRLGECYLHGRGVQQDVAKACGWFGGAADAGDELAERARDELYAVLDPEELLAAEKFAVGAIRLNELARRRTSSDD